MGAPQLRTFQQGICAMSSLIPCFHTAPASPRPLSPVSGGSRRWWGRTPQAQEREPAAGFRWVAVGSPWFKWKNTWESPVVLTQNGVTFFAVSYGTPNLVGEKLSGPNIPWQNAPKDWNFGGQHTLWPSALRARFNHAKHGTCFSLGRRRYVRADSLSGFARGYAS